MLQEYLKDALAKLDNQIEGKVAPLERMKRLLTAQDKKATLLEMAGKSHSYAATTGSTMQLKSSRYTLHALEHGILVVKIVPNAQPGIHPVDMS